MMMICKRFKKRQSIRGLEGILENMASDEREGCH